VTQHRWYVCIAVIALSLASTRSIRACQCLPPPARQSFLSAEILFTGHVTNREVTVTDGYRYPILSTVEVTQWFTKPVGRSIVVHVQTSRGDLFAERDYLVQARCEHGRILLNGCLSPELSDGYGETRLRQIRRHASLAPDSPIVGLWARWWHGYHFDASQCAA
jgi:hypothetical protein